MGNVHFGLSLPHLHTAAHHSVDPTQQQHVLCLPHPILLLYLSPLLLVLYLCLFLQCTHCSVPKYLPPLHQIFICHSSIENCNMSHSIFFDETALHANIHCNKSFVWFKFSGFWSTMNAGPLLRFSRDFQLFPKVMVIFWLHSECVLGDRFCVTHIPALNVCLWGLTFVLVGALLPHFSVF